MHCFHFGCTKLKVPSIVLQFILYLRIEGLGYPVTVNDDIIDDMNYGGTAVHCLLLQK